MGAREDLQIFLSVKCWGHRNIHVRALLCMLHYFPDAFIIAVSKELIDVVDLRHDVLAKDRKAVVFEPDNGLRTFLKITSPLVNINIAESGIFGIYPEFKQPVHRLTDIIAGFSYHSSEIGFDKRGSLHKNSIFAEFRRIIKKQVSPDSF